MQYWHLLAAADDVGTGALTQLISWGAGGVVVILILVGFLDPKRVGDQLRLEVQTWRDIYEKERAAHDQTKTALEKERQRADQAVEQARAALELLQRQQEVAERPPRRRRPGDAD
jgi:hypothetical protein